MSIRKSDINRLIKKLHASGYKNSYKIHKAIKKEGIDIDKSDISYKLTQLNNMEFLNNPDEGYTAYYPYHKAYVTDTYIQDIYSKYIFEYDDNIKSKFMMTIDINPSSLFYISTNPHKYNNKVHPETGYKPIDLLNNKDLEPIKFDKTRYKLKKNELVYVTPLKKSMMVVGYKRVKGNDYWCIGDKWVRNRDIIPERLINNQVKYVLSHLT